MPELTWCTTPQSEPATAAEPESMEQLLGDCARIIPHWTDHSGGALRGWAGPSGGAGAPAVPAASHEALHGVRVPAASARVLEGMSEYGVW